VSSYEHSVGRVSYIVFRTTIDMADLSSITFSGTWLSGEMCTLVFACHCKSLGIVT